MKPKNLKPSNHQIIKLYRRSALRLYFLLPFAFYLLSFTLFAQQNIQWRGTDRSGHYQETGLLKTWGEKGPDLLWHYDELGDGHSSVAVDADKVYITGLIDKKGYIFVFDLTGKLLTKKEYGEEWHKSYAGPRGTITINSGKLYLISGFGDAYCFDQNSLNQIWKKNIFTEFEAKNIMWGINEAPLIVGDKFIATPGGSVHNVVALNKNTGELIWSCAGEGDKSAYCSPLFIGDQQIPLIVTITSDHVVGINAETGQKLWSYINKSKYSIHANTPIYGDNTFLITSGRDKEKGGVMLRLIEGGRNVVEVWTSTELDNYMGAMVKVGNYVYGSGDGKKFWSCTDWKIGKMMWKDTTYAKGNVIAADGMIYGYSDKGEVFLAKATPEKFEVTGNFKITLGTEQHWAHPVIYKGVLYIRHGNSLMAYKVK